MKQPLQAFDLKNFGRKLRQLREEKDLTQDEVARGVGVYKNHVSSWETGKSKPSLDSVIGISNLFKVSIDYLVFDSVPREGFEAINDFELYDYFRKSESLPQEKRSWIKGLVNAVVFQEKVREIPEAEPPKEKELETAPLRKVAGKR